MLTRRKKTKHRIKIDIDDVGVLAVLGLAAASDETAGGMSTRSMSG